MCVLFLVRNVQYMISFSLCVDVYMVSKGLRLRQQKAIIEFMAADAWGEITEQAGIRSGGYSFLKST